jgi:Flp pilus assembly protein TadD
MFTQDFVDDLVAQSVAKGKEYIEGEQLFNAETLLKQARRVAPENAKVLELLGLVLIKQTKYTDAIEVYDRVLELDDKNLDAINNLALAHSKLGARDKAKDLLRRGIDLNPIKDSYWYHLAIQYKDDGDFERCFTIYDEALTLIHDSSELYYHYGVAKAESGDYRRAIELYTQALALDPMHAPSHWNRSLTNLLLGNYKEGFVENEWRFKQFANMTKAKLRFHGKTEWNAVPGNGSVLFYNEQGIGDLLQMLRYMPMVKALGYTTVVEVPTLLFDLVSQSEGVDRVVVYRSVKTPEFDYVASINSLPRLFETTLDAIPKTVPYLKPTGEMDPKEFKDYKGKKKVGICWAGSPYHATDHLRSCYLREFSDIGEVKDVKLFSLQKETGKRFHVGCGVVDLTDGADDMTVVDMSDLMHDFNHTAAIIEQLDLVITVDTAVAHLGGGLGKECWVVLPALPDWRWGSEGDVAPWYPSIRLFRQKHGEQWRDVFARVAQELKK